MGKRRRNEKGQIKSAPLVARAAEFSSAGEDSEQDDRRHEKDAEEEEKDSSQGAQELMVPADTKQIDEGGIFSSCKFHDLGLAAALADHLHGRMGFTSPTRIQQAAIPLILSRKDVLVHSETGSGKTILYVAPIVHHLQASLKKISRVDGTYALVLVPTRELCLQVYEVIQQLVHRFHWLVPGYIMGGENRAKEKARLRKELGEQHGLAKRVKRLFSCNHVN